MNEPYLMFWPMTLRRVRMPRKNAPPVRDRYFPTPTIVTTIIADVASSYGLVPDDLFGRSRHPLVCTARYDAMARLRALAKPNGAPRFSLPHIGYMLGKRDHTTIRVGLFRWEEIVAQRQAEAA